MSPMNIAILAAIGGLIVLLLIARRRRRLAEDDHSGGAGWASPPAPAAAPAPAPAPAAAPSGGSWVVGGGGTAAGGPAAGDGPFGAPLSGAAPRPPAALVTEPGWPLPEADGAQWLAAEDTEPAASAEPAGPEPDPDADEPSWGGTAEPGWFTPSAVEEPIAQEEPAAVTGPMPAAAPAEDADLAAAWASWTPEGAASEPEGPPAEQAHADREPVLAAAQQAAALLVDPAPPAEALDRDLAEAFAAFAVAPSQEPAAPRTPGEEAWAPAAWEPAPAFTPEPAPAPAPPVRPAPGEDVFAAFITPSAAAAETEEAVAWWDLPDPEPAAPEADAAPARTTGRFSVGGHALFPGHEMVGAVQFRAPREDAPTGWSADGQGAAPDEPPAPGEIRLSVDGARNVAPGGVEVLTEPGFAPCEEGFTITVRAADVGPVRVSGRYLVG